MYTMTTLEGFSEIIAKCIQIESMCSLDENRQVCVSEDIALETWHLNTLCSLKKTNYI